MEINSLVTRNKYSNDIIFRIIDIKGNKAILKGEVVRLTDEKLLGEIGDFRYTDIKEAILELYKWYEINEKKIDMSRLLYR